MATPTLSPLEQERNEFGCNLEDIRDRKLRIIRRCPEEDSDMCIFFVHGGGGRACQFKHQIKFFQADADVVGIDFLGQGDSPAPNDSHMYKADQHLQDLMAVFMKYKKQRNLIVAHCYGALHTIRLLTLLKEQDLLSSIMGVVLLALGNRCPVPSSWFKYVPSTFLEWLRPMARARSNATLFTPTTDPSLIEFENSISDNNRMYVMKVIGADCADSARWETWRQQAQHVIKSEKVPVMVIAGKEDGVFPPDTCREFAEFLELPDECFHIVTGVGHLIMLEKPDEVNSMIKEFITKLS